MALEDNILEVVVIAGVFLVVGIVIVIFVLCMWHMRRKADQERSYQHDPFEVRLTPPSTPEPHYQPRIKQPQEVQDTAYVYIRDSAVLSNDASHDMSDNKFNTYEKIPDGSSMQNISAPKSSEYVNESQEAKGESAIGEAHAYYNEPGCSGDDRSVDEDGYLRTRGRDSGGYTNHIALSVKDSQPTNNKF